MSSNQTNSEDKWYSKPIFRSFWSHYNHCNHWLHQNGYKVVRFGDELTDCLDCGQYHNNCSDSQTQLKYNNHKLDALEAIDENECNHLVNSNTFIDNRCEEILESDENEVDISDEYLEFVLQTKRHQKERKKLREKKLRYSERIEYIDISRLDSFSRKSVVPKKGNKTKTSEENQKNENQVMSSNELNRQKMFQFYGEDYNLIQGMEAALQLNFDRLCDLNQPKFWPIMPIRITPNVNPS